MFNSFIHLDHRWLWSVFPRNPPGVLSNDRKKAQHYDGNIAIPGCDKNMPGCAIAAARHNRPTIIVYGGTIEVRFFSVACMLRLVTVSYSPVCGMKIVLRWATRKETMSMSAMPSSLTASIMV